MILYHGSNMAIDTIDLDKCRPYKDFGKGFISQIFRNRPKGWLQGLHGCSREIRH